MKKFKILALVAIMLATMINIPVYAARTVLTVEGENYTSATFSPITRTGTSGFSEGKYIEARHKFDSGTKHSVTYEFKVDKAGRYGLEVITSLFSVNYTSDYTITINDGEEISVPTVAVKLEDITTSNDNKVFKRYYIGNFQFREGKNNITFHLNCNDPSNVSGLVTTFIDAFSLIQEDFAVGSVTTPESCNVYEEGMNVQFDVSFKGLAPSEITYNYELVDFWGKTVAKGTAVCRKGSDTLKIALDSYETGWYILKLTDVDGNSVYRDVAITVVPKLSERIEGDSPFAMDFAGTDVVANVDSVKKLAKAARYAGVQWVRERFTWTKIQKKRGGDYNFAPHDTYTDVISDEGLKISEVFYGNPSWRKDTDLFDLYEVMKAVGEHHADDVQAWELYNEVDGNFQKWTGDNSAAIMKAMAIGVLDSGSNAQIAFGGLCQFVEGNKFVDLQTKNEVMNYSDIYNFHFHITENSEMIQDIMLKHYKDHRELKFHTGTEEKPFWVTEAGIYQFMSNGSLSITQKQHTARYLVTSTAQSLSTGTSKHFWFLLSPYIEAGTKDMGIFDKNYEPSPAYTAEAVMTNVLGHGKYKGKTEIANAEGHVFDSGRGDVLTIWTDEPRYLELNANNAVTVTDIMGHETVIDPVNGKVTVPISFYPVYVSYHGEMPKEDYYAVSFKNDEDLRVELTDAQRVVLRQEIPGQLQEVAKGAGYTFDPSSDVNMELYLYNFNNKEMKGKVYGELNGYEIIMDQNVTIPAMSQISVPVTLKRIAAPVFDHYEYLKFYAVFDGEETSPTVSVTSLLDNEDEVPAYVNKAALDPSGWDVKNITAKAVATATVDPMDPGIMNFNLTFNGGDRWFYPYLSLDLDPKELTNYDGIMYFMRVTSEEDVGKGIPNMFVYLSDGRSYFLGSETGIAQSTEWVKVKRDWDDFILFNSPLGKEFDLRPFDPTLITKIGIGTNPRKNTLNFQIKGVGYYINENKAEEVKSTIDLVSPNLETTRDRNQLSNVVISLPEFEISNITMMISDTVFENYRVEGSTAYADLSNLERGKYVLRILVEDKSGYVTSEEFDVTID